MSFALKLHVAGIRIETISENHPLSADTGPWYSRFAAPNSSFYSDEIVVKLEVVMEKPPDTSALPQVFDAGAWSLYRDGEVHWIVLAAHPPMGSPVWAARLTSDFRSGRVYCDPILARQYGMMGRLANPVLHRLDQLIVMHILGDVGGCILHGTGAILGAQGIAFAGKSGAGKSTLARLLQYSPLSQRGLRLLSDDRVIVREIQRELHIFGTPWPGDAQIASAEHAPLRAVVFLQHGPENHFTRVTAIDAAAALLPVMSVPWYDRERAGRFVEWCHRMVEHVPMWVFAFRPDSNVWKSVERFFQGLEK